VSAPDERTPEQRRALFRVVRGEPDDAELAALTVVLAASGDAEPEPAGPPSAWIDRHATVRRPLHPGPDAWRTFYWPR
jgi:hypothetical protein